MASVANTIEKLRKSIESLLFRGLKPVDPLYLSNRTLGQKLRVAAWIALPCVLLIGFLALSLSGYFRGKQNPYPKELTPAQVASKMLQGIDQHLSLPANRDLDVMDIHITHDGVTTVAGTVKNNTGHAITSAEVIFDLTDARGSRMGAVSARINSLEPQGSATFAFPVEQQAAAAAVVREIHTQ